jgi:hypothetical protein
MSAQQQDPEDLSDDELLERIAGLDGDLPLTQRAERVLQEDGES